MEDERTVKEIMNQVNHIEKNSFNNTEYLTSIDLLLTSDNNERVKDAVISEKFNELKKAFQNVDQLTKEFMSVLVKSH